MRKDSGSNLEHRYKTQILRKSNLVLLLLVDALAALISLYFRGTSTNFTEIIYCKRQICDFIVFGGASFLRICH